MFALSLALVALLLAGVAPRVMARLAWFRRAPRAALLAWQAVSLAAVIAALSAAPAAIPAVAEHTWIVWIAGAATGIVLARLLLSGHRIGTRLRAARRRHTELIDVLGDPREEGDTQLRVLDHATPTAYCLPGRRSRVVLTEGALAALPSDELNAVLAHERAHLRGRHDLLLEYFTVLHTSVPGPVRSPEALREVRLLIEALADRAAAVVAGPVATARALLSLARGQAPEAALGAAGSGDGTTAARMRLLAADPLPAWVVALMHLYAVAVLALPLTLLWLAWH